MVRTFRIVCLAAIAYQGFSIDNFPPTFASHASRGKSPRSASSSDIRSVANLSKSFPQQHPNLGPFASRGQCRPSSGVPIGYKSPQKRVLTSVQLTPCALANPSQVASPTKSPTWNIPD